MTLTTDDPLTELGLSKRLTNDLTRSGYKTIGSLTMHSAAYLADRLRFLNGDMAAITEGLAAHGFEFAKPIGDWNRCDTCPTCLRGVALKRDGTFYRHLDRRYAERPVCDWSGRQPDGSNPIPEPRQTLAEQLAAATARAEQAERAERIEKARCTSAEKLMADEHRRAEKAEAEMARLRDVEAVAEQTHADNAKLRDFIAELADGKTQLRLIAPSGHRQVLPRDAIEGGSPWPDGWSIEMRDVTHGEWRSADATQDGAGDGQTGGEATLPSGPCQAIRAESGLRHHCGETWPHVRAHACGDCGYQWEGP